MDIQDKRRPSPNEYFEFYHRYVSLVPDGDIIDILRDQLQKTQDLIALIPDDKGDFRYAPGKWVIKEVFGHIIDVEWVFIYRAVRFARGDKTPLPGIDENKLMTGANFVERSMKSMAEELRHLRLAGIEFFHSLSESILDRPGIASDCRFTVRSIPYIIAGHELHHVRVIKERYLILTG
jgi:hypothetical protein